MENYLDLQEIFQKRRNTYTLVELARILYNERNSFTIIHITSSEIKS